MSSAQRHGYPRRTVGVALFGIFSALPLAMTGGTAYAHTNHGSAHQSTATSAARAATPAPSTITVTGAPAQPSKVSVAHVCSQSVAKGTATCFAMKQTNNVVPAHIRPRAVTPNATPGGYGPSDLQSAYNLPSSTAGSGQTVAIVDAYDDPNAASDLAAYPSH